MKTPEQIRAYCKRKGYSTEYAEYWVAHCYCEICNEPIVPPHHIRTRGAGGGDNPGNLLGLCAEHHTEAHKGVLRFAHNHQQLHDKVYAALDIVLEPDALNIFVGRGW